MPRPLTPAELDELRAKGLIDDPAQVGPAAYMPPVEVDDDPVREGDALGMAKQKYAAARQQLSDAEKEQALVERIRAERGEDRPESLVQAEIDRERGQYAVLGPGGPVTAEEAEDLREAYTSPDTLAKKRARAAAGAFPLEDHGPSARDEGWVSTAEGLSRESPVGIVTGISAAMDEPIPAGEAVDKPWARDLTEGLSTAITMPLVALSPVDSAVQWLTDGEWNMPVVPTLGEIAEMPGKIKRGVTGAMDDEDADIAPVKVATRMGLALGGGEYVSKQMEALGADPEVIATWDAAVERATHIPSFDAAGKSMYEDSDVSAMESVPYRDLPASLQKGIDLDLVRRAVEPGGMLYDEPAAALLQRAVERGEAELLVEREASELPIGLLRAVVPTALPTNKEIVDEWKKRAEVQDKTGIGDTSKLLRVLAAATVDKEDGEIYFKPSKVQRALSWAGLLPEFAWEADVPLNAGGWNPASWAADALGYEQLANALGEARVPTKAGWESWVATGTLDPYLHEQGWRGSEGALLRPGADTTYLGRIGANVAHADYQGPGMLDALRRQGEPEQSALSKWAMAGDTVVDVLMPVDDLVLAGMGAPVTAARRAWVAGNTGYRAGLRGTRVARAATAGAIPALVGEADRLAALDKVVREGVEAEVRAGNRLFSQDVLGDKPPPPHQDPGTIDWKVQRDWARKLEAAGVKPQDVADALNAVSDENRRLSFDAVARDLKNRGGPADVALRASPEYAAIKAKYDDLAAAGNITPRQADMTMAGLELLAWRAVGDGKVATPEEFFGAHAVEQGGTPGAGAYFQEEPITLSAADVADRFRKAQFIPTTQVLEILGDGRPEYLDEVAKFILEQREKVKEGRLTARDVAKAYLMTVASQRAGAIDAAQVGASLGGPVGEMFTVTGKRGDVQIRPEEAMAAWLFTPHGQRALDAIERGEFDAEAWGDALRVRDQYGNNTLRNFGVFDKPKKGEVTFQNLQEIVDEINAAKGDPAKVARALARVKGAGAAKVPFLAHLLGFGESPTIDSVEINGWLTGEADVGKLKSSKAQLARDLKKKVTDSAKLAAQVAERVKGRFADLRKQGVKGAADLPDEVFGAIMHHWFWDRLKQSETTHAGMYSAMRYAQDDAGEVRGTIERVRRVAAPSILREPGARHPLDTTPDEVGPLRVGMSIDEAEAAIRGEPNEHLLIVAPDGRHLGRWAGDVDRVGLPLDVIDSIPPGTIVTHNHPRVMPALSVGDVLVALRLQANEVRAVLSDGRAAVLRAPTGGWGAARSAMLREAPVTFAAQRAAARENMNAIVRAAGGDPAHGTRAVGFDNDTWTRLQSEGDRDALVELLARHAPDAEYIVERAGGDTSPARPPATAGDDPGLAGGDGRGRLDGDRRRERGVLADYYRPVAARPPRWIDAVVTLRDPAGGAATPSRSFDPPTPPDVLPERHPADTWGDTRGPLGWWMPLDEVESALHGLTEEYVVLYDGAGRQVARWGPEDTRAAGIDPASACVVYPSALDELARMGDATYTHVHPSGGPFSIDDLLIARRANVAEIRAVADGDGFTWVVKRPDGGWPEPDAMRQAYHEAAMAAVPPANRAMDEVIRAAGGNPADGAYARGYNDRTWRRFYGQAIADKWNEAFVPAGLVAERVPNRGPERLGTGVRPAGDVAGAGPEATGVAARRAATPVGGQVTLLEPDAPYTERRGGTILGSIEPTAAANWLIRYFTSADIGTVLHENAHLMRFVMGDDWVDELVTFLPHEPDPARPGKMRLTREGEERFADGFSRLMRGKIAPRGRLRAYYDEFKDRLSDLWMRVRGLPVGVSPEMRRFFDASLNPGGPLRKVNVGVSGDALPARTVKTTVEADLPARLEQEGVKRTGQVLGDVSTLDSPGASIDVVVGSRSAREVDAMEAAGRALADTAVETARRQWGFTGDVTKLTRRTHVPSARAEQVLRKVDNTMRAIHGAIKGGDVIALDPVSAAKMKMHVDMLADTGSGYEALKGSNLLDPGYDFAAMSREDYNRVREATIDRDAGPGARVDRVAAQNVGNAAYGFLKFLSDSGPVGGAVAGGVAGTLVAGPGAGTLIGALGGAFLYSERVSNEMKAAFTVNFRVSEYTSPAVASAFGEVTRELGDITGKFKRAIDDVKRKNPMAMRHAILNAIARSMPVMSVQVPDIPEMLRLHAEWVAPLKSRVEKVPTLDGLLVTLDDVAGFIARNPAVASTARESENQALLALAGYKADPRDFSSLDPGEQQVVADAVGILHDALRRRGEAVKAAGTNIGIAMSGSDEKKLWVGLHLDKNEWGQLEKAAEFYARFYDGDWNGILDSTAAVGQGTSPQSGFDPVAAAAAAITRMMALDVLNGFAAKMLDAGIALDVDTATRLGRQFETFRPIGATDAAGLDRAAFRDEVLRCIQAEMSFKMIGADVVDSAARKKVGTEEAPGTRGQFSPDAYRAALSILSSWGFKPGADTAWKALVLADGSEVLVPEGLWGELTGVMDRAAKAGLAWAARGEAQPVLGRWYNVEGIAQKAEGIKETVTGKVAARAAAREDTLDRRVARVVQGVLDFAGWSYSMSRVNMVSGVGIPNPANFIGNLFGGAVQLYEGKGATGALRVIGRYAAPTASGKVLRHTFLSLFDDYRGLRLPGLWRPQSVMIDGRGMVWTGDSIADEARRAGLHSSQARSESTWKLVDALRKSEGKWWARVVKDFRENTIPGAAWRQFVARPFNWWQDVLMETSTAIDNFYRVGAFIDELSIGKGVDEAAETARRVAFDYNAVTDFERVVLRPAVMFYTYTRRNMDLQWWTMLNHPSRFAGSLRGIRDAQEMVLGEQSELIWSEYMDGRLILGMRETARDSNLHGVYAGVSRVAPPIGPSDSVVLVARLLGTVTGAEEERRETLSMLSPWFQFSFVSATGYDIWAGRSVEEYNTVPAWMVEMDQQALDGLLTTDLFDIEASPEYDPMNAPSKGAPHFTARNARYWWAFRNLMPIGGGRTIDTVTAMARADFLSSAIPGGIVTAGVEAAQEHRASGNARLTDPLVDLARDGIDWLPGINPYPAGDRDYAPNMADDVEQQRVGMKESDELGGLFAMKPVRVPTRGYREDELVRKRERAMDEAASKQERSEPY